MKITEEYITNAEKRAQSEIKWDERFMRVAELVGTWSSCCKPDRQVGAVIARDLRLLTTGYNGAGSGIVSCREREECLRQIEGIESGTRQEVCYAVHAEQNAIIQAARIGVPVQGATLYCTHQPCVICARMIINCGIRRVVFRSGYPDEFAVRLLKEAGVVLHKL
ncbi:MAG: dCMP deaminase family protein [Firmicutes bacterium]|nr:dCMP deaminase family protein [Bacillota bacterium]